MEPTVVKHPRGLSEKAKAAGVVIMRRVTGHAYARNGNAHNPTERVSFTAHLNGRVIAAPSSRMSYVIEVANLYVAEEMGS